ncbi:YwiC-like family protein [Paenibacillus sp. M1]|uniref:YwiC-like family protein n=1 Tax=Paenibacillus haidiansis TaxID=1574488 RepID=A0ABU7VPU2_9BACL
MKKSYIPKQHGAWAMLAVPFLSGMFASNPTWSHALLFAGWMLVYLFSYPFLQWIRTKKTKNYKNPMLLYGGLLIPVAAGLIWIEPLIWRWIPLFLPLFIVNCYFARRNRERAFLNDLAAVIQFSLMTFVAYYVGNGLDWWLAAELFALNVLYFTGTVFYVKTIIREKNNVRFYWVSVAYHTVILGVAALLFPKWMWVPLLILLIRAFWSPRTHITVKRCGMLEILYSVFVVATVLIVY